MTAAPIQVVGYLLTWGFGSFAEVVSVSLDPCHEDDGTIEPLIRLADHAASLAASEARVAELQETLAQAVPVMEHYFDRAEAAEQSLAEAVKDAERLDWLEGFDPNTTITLQEWYRLGGTERFVEISDADDSVISSAPTLRAAIDALLPKGEGETS